MIETLNSIDMLMDQTTAILELMRAAGADADIESVNVVQRCA